MKAVLKIATLLCVGSALCLADSWTGKLVDATCMDRQQSANQPNNPEQQAQLAATCAPRMSTTTFGIQLPNGQIYKLDTEGNAKAAEAFKTAHHTDEPMEATVSGSLEGQTVKVESIDIH